MGYEGVEVYLITGENTEPNNPNEERPSAGNRLNSSGAKGRPATQYVSRGKAV